MTYAGFVVLIFMSVITNLTGVSSSIFFTSANHVSGYLAITMHFPTGQPINKRYLN